MATDKPFDWDTEAQGFDWETEAKPVTKSAPKVGAGEHFVNQATEFIPFGRQLVNALAAAQMKTERARGALGLPGGLRGRGAELTPQAKAELAAMGELPSEPEAPGLLDTYREIRADRASRVEAGAEQNPLTNRLAQGTGLALSLLAPGPKFGSRLPGILGKASAAAKTGAAYGAGLGVANGSADLTRGEFGQALSDMVGIDRLKSAATNVSEGNYGRAALDALGAGAIGGAAGGAVIGAGVEKVAPLLAPLCASLKREA
jgi:hypothetical protein